MSTEAFEIMQSDPALGPYVTEHGQLTIEPATDLFERLVVSLIRQQVSMEAAAAIRKRLFDAVEITPEAVCAADDYLLMDAGLSAAKATYLNHVGQAFLDNGYDHEYFATMTDEAVLAEMTSITGIGPWTAKMFLLFGLGRPDVFPIEDLGIRRGMEVVYETDLTRAEMCEYARAWQPYRSYASLYLWRAYEG